MYPDRDTFKFMLGHVIMNQPMTSSLEQEKLGILASPQCLFLHIGWEKPS